MTIYSAEEVYNSTLEYFNGDELATDTFIKKYCLKDFKGNLYEKSPVDMHHRLSKEFARIESNYSNSITEEEIFKLFKDFKYLVPQGSPMEGIGNPFKYSTLSNCYVIKSPKDSYSGILFAEREMIELYKRRGGVGLSLHTLRSKNMPTSSVSEKSSGIVLFAERYSNTTKEVAQDGRRGALMLSLRISHPDSELFIDSKLEEDKITGANISIMIDDKFMKAVENDEDYELFFENFKGRDSRVIKAKRLWNKIVFNAWRKAEPGVLFWDTILRESPANSYGEDWQEKSTNPCSELPLPPYDSCRLLAINLYSYVISPFSNKATFNWDLFKKHVNKAQRLMDDMVELEIEKIDSILFKLRNEPDIEDEKSVEINLWKKIREKAINGRRTGLGITAEGDMLAALNLRYGTKEATKFTIKVHKTLAIESYKSSIEMAMERGSFPLWNGEVEMYNPFLRRVLDELRDTKYQYMYENFGRRNIANLTIAPTGSVSILTQTSSGIEPAFSISYKRKKRSHRDIKSSEWVEYNVFHHKFVEWYSIDSGLNNYSEALNYLQNCDEELLNKLVKVSPYNKSTANNINWVEKVEMQGQIQKWVDHSISVTVNIPKETSVEMVDKIYKTAYKSGCKGCTIYREGSREGILVNSKNSSDFNYIDAIKREKRLECDIYHKQVLGVGMMILVGLLEGKPYEIFAFKNGVGFPEDLKKGFIIKIKKGHYRLESRRGEKLYSIDNIIEYLNETEQNETRSISTMLRHRINPKYIVQQISSYATITSQQKAMERVLRLYIEEPVSSEERCPECGGILKYETSCKYCISCSWGACN